MTSLDPPDYKARFRLTPEEFQGLNGIAFSVSIVLENQGKMLKGMIIIPQLGNDPDQSEMYDDWLWLDKASALPSKKAIHVNILSPCDPMLIPEEKDKLKKYRGMKLAGVITHNNNADVDSRLYE